MTTQLSNKQIKKPPHAYFLQTRAGEFAVRVNIWYGPHAGSEFSLPKLSRQNEAPW